MVLLAVYVVELRDVSYVVEPRDVSYVVEIKRRELCYGIERCEQVSEREPQVCVMMLDVLMSPNDNGLMF